MIPLYIDISAFQPIVSSSAWYAYKAWSATGDGTSRIAVKATEGIGFTDANYQGNLSAVRAAGIDVVIHYHYARPDLGNDPVAEAQYMASVVKGLSAHDVIMLDFEENASSGTNADWAYKWLAEAESLFGRTPVIYASRSMVQNRLQDSRLPHFPLIVAEWPGSNTPSPVPSAPAPWTKLWAWQYTDSLSGVPGFPVSVDANAYLAGSLPLVLHNGCVLDLQKSYQLDGGSQDKCGPWSVSELRFAGLPGQGPNGTASDVQAWAHAEYTQWIGPDVVSDQNGSSIDNMHQFLTDSTDPKTGGRNLYGKDITAISPTSQRTSDNAHIIAALNAGYPVLVTVNEQSVIRRDGSNPYPWQPALGPVNHIFTVVGHTSDGYFLVDDELNQGDSWPDAYNMSKLEVFWASIVQVIGPDPANPWLAAIPSNDPTTWPAGFNAQRFAGAQGGGTVPVPNGWHDDGTRLTAPNGHYLVQGFRNVVLDAPTWDPGNEPQEEEQSVAQVLEHRPDLGAGTAVHLRDNYFWWTAAKGVVNEQELGLELFLKQQKLAQAEAQIAQLQAQVQQLENSGTGIPPALQTIINNVAAQLPTVSGELTTLGQDLQPYVKQQ